MMEEEFWIGELVDETGGTGFFGITVKGLKRFRELGSCNPGERKSIPLDGTKEGPVRGNG